MLLWKPPASLSTLNTPLAFQSPSWPSLVLWIKFKILALIFIALYNSRQLLLAHNCCNNLSVVAIHSYIPMSTPTHTPVCKHGMYWLMKDRGTIKAKSAYIFVENVRFHVSQNPSHTHANQPRLLIYRTICFIVWKENSEFCILVQMTFSFLIVHFFLSFLYSIDTSQITL